MQLGMIGLGRMGLNMVRRLLEAGHELVVFDLSADAVSTAVQAGAKAAGSPAELVAALTAPRAVWLMLPAGVTGKSVAELGDLLERGDVLVDGGNSYYRDDVDRAKALRPKGIHYLDVGTSGGVWGYERGYCLMVGGEPEGVAVCEPVFSALAPGVGSIPRTPGRAGEPAPAERGWLHCGPPGAGHFVKMIHNGIEYTIMGAYAEGLNVLKGADIGSHQAQIDAETAPLRDPEYYTYDFDLPAVAEVWRRGSVIGSWLLDLTAAALVADPDLSRFNGRVSDSGEGRWTSQAALEEGIPAPLLTAAVYSRFISRGYDEFANKVQSAQRKQFGGHEERPA